jgi:hypothetical protein
LLAANWTTIWHAVVLGGTVEEVTGRELLELSAVRNCLAHRRGIVDARFREACGTTKLQIGEPILLTSEPANRYRFAVLHPAATVLERIKARYAPEEEVEINAKLYLEQLTG